MATLPDKKPGGDKHIRSPNPRRTSPKMSISPTGLKRQKLSHSPDGEEVSTAPKHIKLYKVPSDKSGTSQSASQWFDNINQHVAQSKKGNTNYDDEPPFFMENQRTYMPNPIDISDASKSLFGPHSRFDSENEDLRGVIDDLTIENKRLKQIVRRQHSHRASPSAESQDKLFEVRMHGLPPEKRRELEFLLKNFATSVHTSAPSLTLSNSGSALSSSPVGTKPKTDSGYVSNSNSGQTSSGTSQRVADISKSSRNRNIKSFLHDIPDTLLPRQNPVIMSERARMALVVRRLEQLFTGKSAAPGEHSQPLQQQEVSHMAARADARNSKKRKADGPREAHILPPDSKVNFDAPDGSPQKRSHLTTKISDESDVTAPEGQLTTSRPGSPDQRPTRPLDLDIHRAQVAAENIQYIRHLGLSSPHLETSTDKTESPWMYLNLLINMAQLHTVNVTPEFVRRAVKKLSTKFELAKDGHKVRWVGGSEGTVFSREDEKALEVVDNNNNNNESPHESTEDSGTGGGSSKRSKTNSTSNPVVSITPSEDKMSGLQTSTGSKQQASTATVSNQLSSNMTRQTAPTLQTGSSFDYKPIVYRQRPRDPLEETYLQDSDSSHDSSSRNSSDLAHALSRSNLNQRNSDEGLITFFKDSHFCSDYSGDKMPTNMLKDRDILPGEVVGVPNFLDPDRSALRYGDSCYFTPQFGPKPLQGDQNANLPRLDLTPLSVAGEYETQPLEFVASGVGGVTPDDNFAIDVKIGRSKTDAAIAEKLKRIPFTGNDIQARYAYRTASANKVDLLPSRLPPPSYIFFTSSSSSGNPDMEESDSNPDDSSSSMSDEEPAPPGFLQHWSAEGSGEAYQDDDDKSSSSVDMLALARAADPERIAEQERQYMITQPGGQGVAGSLAATVGASRSSVSRSGVPSEAAAAGSEMDDDDGDDDDDAVDD